MLVCTDRVYPNFYYVIRELKNELKLRRKYVPCCAYKKTAVAQWLRCCATNWKVAGSIPAGVIGVFH